MLLVVRSHMGKGVEERVRVEGRFSLCCEQLCEGLLLGRGIRPPARPPLSPRLAVFVVGTGWDLGPAAPGRPHPHLGRPRLFSPLLPLPRRCRGSLGVSMTTLCVWEGQMWGLPARGPFLGDHLSMSPT
uniref:Uncharacterized protein n=1 Tax=Equus asinus TaxID=9793 RepID=A0A8C4ME97_EQUAS